MGPQECLPYRRREWEQRAFFSELERRYALREGFQKVFYALAAAALPTAAAAASPSPTAAEAALELVLQFEPEPTEQAV